MPPATEEGVSVVDVQDAPAKLENGVPEHDTKPQNATRLQRSLREREHINYNEEALQRKVSNLIVDDSPPAKRSKHGSLARALQQVDHNTTTERRTADSVNLPHNMLSDEEEGLLPDGANEALYIKVCIPVYAGGHLASQYIRADQKQGARHVA